jgi:hypothetical protein
MIRGLEVPTMTAARVRVIVLISLIIVAFVVGLSVAWPAGWGWMDGLGK